MVGTRAYWKQDQSAGAVLGAILDSASEGIIVRAGEELLYANPAVFDLLGIDDDHRDAILQPITDWVHPDDRDTVRSQYRARLEGRGDDAPYEFRLRRIDGDYIWVSCRASIVPWGDGEAVAAYLTDISASVEARNLEQVTSDLFKNIFNVTPEFMLLFRLANNEVLDVNPAFLNVFGRRRDQVVAAEVGDLDLWADSTFFDRFVEELKSTASLTNIPAALKTRGGAIRHFRLFARRIDGSSEPLLLMTGRDVTEEISRAQELQRNRDAAELSNRTKSEFLANMSHELRTPLNAILGFSELIRDRIGGESMIDRYSEYASDIHKSGTHLLSIINDILDLSKVEAGRLEAHVSWVDPVVCLEMCLRLVQQRATESKISVECDLDPSIMLEADERLLKQIGLNLLSNSVKFTNPGGNVQLSLVTLRDGGACLSVADSGIGMTAEEIAIARRPFGQVDSSLSRSQEGSGLGLPLVVAFADKMNCKLTIESEPGVGTKISVFFPPSKVRVREESSDRVAAG